MERREGRGGANDRHRTLKEWVAEEVKEVKGADAEIDRQRGEGPQPLGPQRHVIEEGVRVAPAKKKGGVESVIRLWSTS